MALYREAVYALNRAGLTVTEEAAGSGHPNATVLDIHAQGAKARFAAVRRNRTPYPGEIATLADERDKIAALGTPLLSAPYVSESLGASLIKAGWSWVDDSGNWDLRARSLMLQRRVSQAPPTPKRRSLPSGAGSLSLIRWLAVHASEAPVGATAMSELARVTRARGTQILVDLECLGLAKKASRGKWTVDRGSLLDRFVQEYPGPGGPERYFYTLQAPGDAAATLVTNSDRRRKEAPWVISGDVAADLVAPWRRPSHLVVYPLDVELQVPKDWVEAHGFSDANVVMRYAADETVARFRTTGLLGKVELPLADPTQILWEMHQLGGDDRLEAAEKVRAWILRHP